MRWQSCTWPSVRRFERRINYLVSFFVVVLFLGLEVLFVSFGVEEMIIKAMVTSQPAPIIRAKFFILFSVSLSDLPAITYPEAEPL